MTVNETAARPQRRAGTFTLGIVLVAAGLGMMASLFWPALEIGWLLKMSPLILVCLGVEVLLAARGGGKVKYDWLGMLLCFILVGAGLVFYAAAWYYENGDYFNTYDCSRWADKTSYRMEYGLFNGYDSHTLRLEAGDVLEGRVDRYSGWLEMGIRDQNGEMLASPVSGDQRFEIDKSGNYTIFVHGRRASGGFRFDVVPSGEGPAPEEDESPEELEQPEA